MSEYRHRLAAEITPEQYRRLSAILPHGMQKPLFQALVQGVLELHSRGGLPALAAITSNHIELSQIAQVGAGLTRKDRIAALRAELKALGGLE